MFKDYIFNPCLLKLYLKIHYESVSLRLHYTNEGDARIDSTN